MDTERLKILDSELAGFFGLPKDTFYADAHTRASYAKDGAHASATSTSLLPDEKIGYATLLHHVLTEELPPDKDAESVDIQTSLQRVHELRKSYRTVRLNRKERNRMSAKTKDLLLHPDLVQTPLAEKGLEEAIEGLHSAGTAKTTKLETDIPVSSTSVHPHPFIEGIVVSYSTTFGPADTIAAVEKAQRLPPSIFSEFKMYKLSIPMEPGKEYLLAGVS